MDEKQFREHHDTLGKPAKVIDSWLEYYKIAKVTRERKLNSKQVLVSLESAEVLFNKYQNLAKEISADKSSKLILKQSHELADEIDYFHTHDQYMIQAFIEESRVPYWDIDENYGGS